MIEDTLQETKERMAKTITDLENELKRVRTGRASLSLLDGIRVDYYGTPTPLNQVAKLAVPEPILTKPCRLDEQEMDRVRVHPALGAEILERIDEAESTVRIQLLTYKTSNRDGEPFDERHPAQRVVLDGEGDGSDGDSGTGTEPARASLPTSCRFRFAPRCVVAGGAPPRGRALRAAGWYWTGGRSGRPPRRRRRRLPQRSRSLPQQYASRPRQPFHPTHHLQCSPTAGSHPPRPAHISLDAGNPDYGRKFTN